MNKSVVCENVKRSFGEEKPLRGVSFHLPKKGFFGILGSSGSGKSTLSRDLRDITGLPLFHLDNIWWKPDKSHISREEFDQKLDEILLTDRWMIDGNYSRTYEVRFRA